MFDGTSQPHLGCVLAVGAHPDDAVLSVGGLLAQFANKGHQVVILTLSSGELAGDPMLREAEETEAARRLGAMAAFARLPDGSMSQRDVISAIDRIIAEYAPGLCLIHSPQDTHQDHVTAHEASLVSCRRVPTLLSYESPSSIAFHPTVTLDVTVTWQQKLHALAAFGSQLSTRPLLDWVDAAGRYRAWPRHVGSYCEGLRMWHSKSLPTVLSPLAQPSDMACDVGLVTRDLVYDCQHAG
jgi:LmbE family N-acetylglucosaminyl deacetylase